MHKDLQLSLFLYASGCFDYIHTLHLQMGLRHQSSIVSCLSAIPDEKLINKANVNCSQNRVYMLARYVNIIVERLLCEYIRELLRVHVP